MSNEELHIDGDFTLNIPHFEADFTENEQPKMQADFKIQTGGSTSFANITGDPYDNAALSDALNQKADTSTVETLSETVENNYTELDGKITDESDARTQADTDLQSNIDDVADDLSIETDNRQTADADLQDNIDTLDNKIDTHIADKSNPHEVTKAQIGLGNVDNTSDLNKPISTATQTALNGKQNTINDLSEIRTNASNGQSAYNTIQNYGDIVTYDASYFATSVQGQKADTALQPNDDISELNNDAGYITSASLPTVNNSTITFQKNNVTVGDINLNQANNETINFNIPTTASDVNALPDTTTINDLTTTAQQNAIDSGANTSNIGQIATNTSNISSLSTTVTNNYNTLDGRITSEVSALNTTIGTETTNRQNADNNLQSQIDAIVSSSDVFDIVGTYAELQAYDISIVPVNDIIKVLVDSTHSNAATYYRCVETGGVKSWSYIGSEGAYYTKSETDTLLNDKYDASNPAGYTTNKGTVTSVNNTQPDANGNVTISVTGGANTDLSNLTATGEAHFAKIFIAEYETTTYQEVLNAYNAGKTIFCKRAFTGLNSDYIFSLSNIKLDLSEFYFSWITGKPVTFNGTDKPAYFNVCAIKLTDSSVWSYEYTAIPTTNYAVKHTPQTSVGSGTKLVYVDSIGTATASTSTVGGSSTPVYLNNGTITSTGLSIASSRFDGQWVLFSDPISLSTATSATTTDVTSTIKSNMGTAGTDSYKYELSIQTYCKYKSATGGLNVITSNQTTTISGVSSGTTMGRFFGRITVAADKLLKFQRTAAMDTCNIYFCGYRRIGTNS